MKTEITIKIEGNKSIEFKEGVDVNYSVNRFIDFLLYMYEEQLYYNNNSQKFKNITHTIERAKKRTKVKIDK